MATGFVGKLQTMVGVIGVVALGISAVMITGVNPLHYADDAWNTVVDKLRGKLTDPLPQWTERVGGPPVAAAVSSDRVIAMLNGAVEARRLSDGSLAWTRTVDWAVPAGDVVVTGRSNGTGIEALDASTGRVRWRAPRASDAWPYQDMVISVSCKRDSCAARARSTTDGTVRWRRAIPSAAQRLTGYPPLDEAVDRHGTLRVGYPGEAPRLVGVVSDRQVTVIDTGSGARLGRLPEDSTTRVVTVGDRVVGVVAKPAPNGGCRYRVRAWQPSGDQVWRRVGYDLGTVSGSGCEQRVDPLTGGGAIAAVRANGRPALLGVRGGEVRWTGKPGATVVGLARDLAVVREKSGRLIAVSTSSGSQLWSRAASPDATVILTGTAVAIQDRDKREITMISPTGSVLRTWTTQATVIGATDSGLILRSGRTVGYSTW